MQMRIVDGEGADGARGRVRAFETDGDPAQAAPPHPASPVIVVPDILTRPPDGCRGHHVALGAVVVGGRADIGRSIGHAGEVGGWRPGGSGIRQGRRSAGGGCHRISEAHGEGIRGLAGTGCGRDGNRLTGPISG